MAHGRSQAGERRGIKDAIAADDEVFYCRHRGRPVNNCQKEEWFMADAQYYEAEILKALKTLPADALPKVWRLILLVREEFFASEQGESAPPPRPPTSHEQTQRLLASSASNWAQELIAAREDRL
jgi:hypothetical protein